MRIFRFFLVYNSILLSYSLYIGHIGFGVLKVGFYWGFRGGFRQCWGYYLINGQGIILKFYHDEISEKVYSYARTD